MQLTLSRQVRGYFGYISSQAHANSSQCLKVDVVPASTTGWPATSWTSSRQVHHRPSCANATKTCPYQLYSPTPNTHTSTPPCPRHTYATLPRPQRRATASCTACSRATISGSSPPTSPCVSAPWVVMGVLCACDGRLMVVAWWQPGDYLWCRRHHFAMFIVNDRVVCW